MSAVDQQPPTYSRVLKQAESRAEEKGREPSAIKRLLMHHARFGSTELLLRLDETMPDAERTAFEQSVEAYLERNVPVQYLIGVETFFGYDFQVGDGVFIPRFETEELAAAVLDEMDRQFAGAERIRILDIGTGSGCLAITLMLEDGRVEAVATDVSKQALHHARANCEKHGVAVDIREGDLFEPVRGERFDVVVSNPPYIPVDEPLDPAIADYEPELALYGGDDGLDFYKRILKQVRSHLNPGAFVAFEHGAQHAAALSSYVHEALPGCRVSHQKDMQGRDRMTFVHCGSRVRHT